MNSIHSIILLAAMVLAGQAHAAVSYNVADGTTTQITEFTVCKRITNSTGKAIFVPTNTSGEWSAFYNNPPASVNVRACCTGTFYNGYCFNRSLNNAETCTTVCSTLGGCDQNGLNYANDSTRCGDIFVATGKTGLTFSSSEAGTMGCNFAGSTNNTFISASTPTCGASLFNRKRMCSCVN